MIIPSRVHFAVVDGVNTISMVTQLMIVTVLDTVRRYVKESAQLIVFAMCTDVDIVLAWWEYFYSVYIPNDNRVPYAFITHQKYLHFVQSINSYMLEHYPYE